MDGLWTSLALAAGLVLFFEGALYAAFPDAMKKAMRAVFETSSESLRTGGLIAACIGVGLIWAII